jgi:hypothetical protein
MFYKILEKYSHFKIEHNTKQIQESNKIMEIEQEIIRDFLDLYDKDIKQIHQNEERIEKDLKILYKENDKFQNISNQTIEIYDNFMEFLKEAGDLYNWCNIVEKEMNSVHDCIATKYLSKSRANSYEKEKEKDINNDIDNKNNNDNHSIES